jgi:hypothetical protein
MAFAFGVGASLLTAASELGLASSRGGINLPARRRSSRNLAAFPVSGVHLPVGSTSPLSLAC